jgi:hypothetical protein
MVVTDTHLARGASNGPRRSSTTSKRPAIRGEE